MTTPPSLSIIVPCYNGLPYVLESIASVIAQADSEIDVIVVDDGSTDGSSEALAERFGDSIKLLRKQNGGAASARNYGLQYAKGDLVIWLDADDDLAPHTLRSRREAFAHDSALEMLVGRNKIIDVDTGEIVKISPENPLKESYLTVDLMCRRNLPHLNILTFRRSAITKVGLFDTDLHNGQDHDFWFRCWARLNWKFVDQIQAIQRHGEFASLSRSKGKLGFNANIGKMLRKNRDFFRQVTGSNAAWNRGYSVFCADFAMHHLHRYKKTGAFRWAMNAIWVSPLHFDRRAVPVAFEAALPGPLYRCLRQLYHRISKVRKDTHEQEPAPGRAADSKTTKVV